MIDWSLADRIARAVASRTPVPPGGHEALAAEVEAFAGRSAELVSAYTGLSAAALPDPETVDRGGWAAINLRSMRSILDPVAERGGGSLTGPLRLVTGTLLAAEVGVLSGFLATRVLGQYEFPVLDPDAPSRLLFVGPNLAGASRSLAADEQALVRWVALHETTHALQFGGVPWLRGHLASRVGALVQSLDVQVDVRKLLRVPRVDDLRALADTVRRGGVVTLAMGAERRALLDELQATMALLEGYAEHVMDAVGADLLPELDELRAGLERRRRGRSGLLKLVERLLGMDMKLRQYEEGKAFCDAMVAEGGIASLNWVWTDVTHLPTAAELAAPRLWLQRVAPATR